MMHQFGCLVFMTFGLVAYAAPYNLEQEELSKNECPRYFERFRNKCYRFVTEALTWAQADQYCTYYQEKNYDTHLATINEVAEHQFLRSLMQPDPNLNTRSYWIGLNKVDRFRDWLWAPRNRAMQYEEWAPGEPGGEGNCALMWQGNEWKFVDWDCNEYLPFVCEVDLAP